MGPGIANANLLSALVLAAGMSAGAAAEPARQGIGWTMKRLDLEVTVDPEARRLELTGSARLELEALPESFGPTLLMNTRQNDDGVPVMTFTAVTAPGAAVVIREAPEGGVLREAEIRFPRPLPRGTAIEVLFTAVSSGAASQLVVDKAAALASWTSGWHPFTNSTADDDAGLTPGLMAAPGEVTLNLPPGWVGLVDGELAEREARPGGTRERWTALPGAARSFVAGPYETSIETAGARRVVVYMLPGERTMSRPRLAALIGETMRALEARFGDFPFPTYGVVEVPRDLPGQIWSAASQQTFITAKTPHFEHEHGNLPLWAHEMAHAWWGNTVATRGAGSKWCGESLANFSAYVAIEALEGAAAMREFLGFSRSGYSPYQSAAGYFSFVRQGADQPIATMGSGHGTHELADSKGSWIYHMLRRRIGDEVFFAVLRGIIRDYAHREIDQEEIRLRFVAAAPDDGLEAFFAQWLDRAGAPVFDVDWHATPHGDGVVVRIEQLQEGVPFAVELPIEIELAGGERVIERVPISSRVEEVRIATTARPAAVRLDPEYDLLIWRPEYGPRPGGTAAAALPPPEVVAAVVGVYTFRGMGKRIKVFERDGEVWAEPAGSPPLRLIHRHGRIFEVDAPGGAMLQVFDEGTTPAASFVSREGDQDYIADRLDEP